MKYFTTTLFALFLLSTLTSHLPSTTAVPEDTDGNPLRNGGTYYIVPILNGEGGGIERAITGNETSPLTVVQSPFEASLGLPIRISSPFKIGIITEDIPLELSFTFEPPTPSKWTIVKDSTQPEGLSVKLTGYVDTVQGWFYIKKDVGIILYHKLLFCPLSSGVCSDIGIHIDSDGNRRLVLTENNPFLLEFKIATSSDA